MFNVRYTPLLLAVALLGAGTGRDGVFIKQALQSGTHEVAQAALEATNSTDSRVRQFAGRMTTDHQQANQQLIVLGNSRGIDTSFAPSQPAITAMTPAPNGVANEPASGGRVLAPTAYFREEIAAHEKAIALFEREASSGTDSQVRAFAKQTLPILRGHLKLAQKYLSQEQQHH